MVYKWPLALRLLAFMGIISLVSAKCRLHNMMKEKGKKETRKDWCKTHDKGRWTFSMATSLSMFPNYVGRGGRGAFDNYSSGRAFVIYDDQCYPRGMYSPDNEGNDCGIPYEIQENFLPYVIGINTINFGTGSGYFKFAYANGEYMTSENDGKCVDASKGLAAAERCSASWPIEGEKSKDQIAKEKEEEKKKKEKEKKEKEKKEKEKKEKEKKEKEKKEKEKKKKQKAKKGKNKGKPKTTKQKPAKPKTKLNPKPKPKSKPKPKTKLKPKPKTKPKPKLKTKPKKLRKTKKGRKKKVCKCMA
ncbi:hypothetical protein AJ79_07694 [Helicocarpus griseus UAMH5409]|uniref:Uncharacterized protein n=1 Tax=Helicocarpus griseus UAMH5409 TaxID=1447875 RepID=A0A2B7WZX4_9EURO|nr:hypothetical protein AJ79_07694 [Helicocarpus griseus UAMH5409]